MFQNKQKSHKIIFYSKQNSFLIRTILISITSYPCKKSSNQGRIQDYFEAGHRTKIFRIRIDTRDAAKGVNMRFMALFVLLCWIYAFLMFLCRKVELQFSVAGPKCSFSVELVRKVELLSGGGFKDPVTTGWIRTRFKFKHRIVVSFSRSKRLTLTHFLNVLNYFYGCPIQLHTCSYSDIKSRSSPSLVTSFIQKKTGYWFQI